MAYNVFRLHEKVKAALLFLFSFNVLKYIYTLLPQNLPNPGLVSSSPSNTSTLS
jgi:hypothetical protein